MMMILMTTDAVGGGGENPPMIAGIRHRGLENAAKRKKMLKVAQNTLQLNNRLLRRSVSLGGRRFGTRNRQLVKRKGHNMQCRCLKTSVLIMQLQRSRRRTPGRGTLSRVTQIGHPTKGHPQHWGPAR